MFSGGEGFFKGFSLLMGFVTGESKGGFPPSSVFLEPRVNMGLGIGFGLLCILICAVVHFFRVYE